MDVIQFRPVAEQPFNNISMTASSRVRKSWTRSIAIWLIHIQSEFHKHFYNLKMTELYAKTQPMVESIIRP